MVFCSLIASNAIRAFISALQLCRCLDFISALFPRQRFYIWLTGPNFGGHFIHPPRPVLIKPYKTEQRASLGILKMSYRTARKGDIGRRLWAARTVSTLSPFSHLELGKRPFISKSRR